MDKGVSYSAGVAYFYYVTPHTPELFLVLQKAGEENPQKSGGVFLEKRTWKMPMGHFDPLHDKDVIDTALREFREESGLQLSREMIRPELSVSLRIPSERPDAEFHEDVFFCVIGKERFDEAHSGERDERIETTQFFPLDRLPTGVGKESRGAEMAHGHRKKLAKLLLACAKNPQVKAILEFLK